MNNNKKETTSSAEIINTDKQEGIFKEIIPSNAKIQKLKDKESLEYPYFLNRVTNRVNRGYAPIIVVCGEERVGKSEVALRISEHLYNNFNVMKGNLNKKTVKKYLTYNVKEFLKLVTENERKAIMIDEAGSLLKSTNHMNKFNQKADEVIQTLGFKQNIYIFILPRFKDLDSRIRNKADIKIEVYQRGKAKVTGIKSNFGKMRNNELDFRKLPLPSWKVTRPPKKLRKSYNQKEKQFKNNNAKKILEELEKEENKQQKNIQDL